MPKVSKKQVSEKTSRSSNSKINGSKKIKKEPRSPKPGKPY